MENFLNDKSRQPLQEEKQEGDVICFLEVPHGKIFLKKVGYLGINHKYLASVQQVWSRSMVLKLTLCVSVRPEKRESLQAQALRLPVYSLEITRMSISVISV